MDNKSFCFPTLLLVCCGVLIARPAAGQGFEVGFLLGQLRGSQAGPGTRMEAGLALQANAAVGVYERAAYRLMVEGHFLASPQRKVVSSAAAATRDVASLYVVPGLRVQLRPKSRVQPFVAGGFGFGVYEHSLLTQDGRPNGAARTKNVPLASLGGGVTVKLLGWLHWRAEARDFVSTPPDLNLGNARASRHNVALSTGFVLTR